MNIFFVGLTSPFVLLMCVKFIPVLFVFSLIAQRNIQTKYLLNFKLHTNPYYPIYCIYYI